MNIFPFQFYVGVIGFAWSVFFAGYVCGSNQYNLWLLIVLVICGVLCASMSVACLNDVLKELRQLRVWHGEDLRSRQEAAAARHQAPHEDDATDPGTPKAV